MKCIGFGEFKGKCDNEVNTNSSKWWCEKCEDLRREHITKQMHDLLAQMERDGAEAEKRRTV